MKGSFPTLDGYHELGCVPGDSEEWLDVIMMGKAITLITMMTTMKLVTHRMPFPLIPQPPLIPMAMAMIGRG